MKIGGRRVDPLAVAFISALSILGAHPLAAQSSASADELIGLWKAKRWFGPDVRGPVIIRRTGETYTADLMGRILPVRVEKGDVSFDMPSGQGSFRGKVESSGALLGHWYPPNALAMQAGTGKYASPVHFKRDDPNRWTGHILPYEDAFTFYLLVRKQPDGVLGAFLHNPERGWLGGVERLVRDGDVVKLIGKRLGQKEDSELATGTYDAEGKVITLGFPVRGGAYEFRREDEQSEFYPRGKNPGRYVYRAPLARDDGWTTGTLEEANIDRAGIEKFVQMLLDMPMESVSTSQVQGLLMARRGKLVLEEYFHGEHRDKLHETRSASKSLTATVVGAAIHAGAPLKPTTPVYQVMNGGAFPADLDPRKRAMTLEHLLTMSSGFFCDDNNPEAPGNEEVIANQTEEPDYYRYTLKVPMAMSPGEKAVYCSSNPNLALGVLGRTIGESPLYAFDRHLAAPMKIHRYGWLLDPAGNPYGGGGVQMLPRDFMKLGQLMLDGGTWRGRRMLSREFVARASAPLYRLGTGSYGYAWWGMDLPYENRKVHAFFAGGRGGQVVMVIPELELVIAMYGANYHAGRTGFRIQEEFLPNYILPAVRGASPVSGPVSRSN